MTKRMLVVMMMLGMMTGAAGRLQAQKNIDATLQKLVGDPKVELTLDDFNRLAARTPHIADLKPGGRYVMADLDKVGGVPVILKELLDSGHLHGDALTVTGQTMAEALADAPKDRKSTRLNSSHRT